MFWIFYSPLQMAPLLLPPLVPIATSLLALNSIAWIKSSIYTALQTPLPSEVKGIVYTFNLVKVRITYDGAHGP